MKQRLSPLLQEAGSRSGWKHKGESHRLSGIQGGGRGPVSARMPRKSLNRAMAMRRKSAQAEEAACTKLLSKVRSCLLEEPHPSPQAGGIDREQGAAQQYRASQVPSRSQGHQLHVANCYQKVKDHG